MKGPARLVSFAGMAGFEQAAKTQQRHREDHQKADGAMPSSGDIPGEEELWTAVQNGTGSQVEALLRDGFRLEVLSSLFQLSQLIGRLVGYWDRPSAEGRSGPL